MALCIRPISLKDANSYIIQNHRHHGKAQGHKFSLGVYEGDELHGVAVVGRPVSRRLDDGMTCEVIRLCTDGTYNACSMLYSRCARVCKEMGYRKIITYILDSESGVSLRASGWTCEAEMVGGGDWAKCQRRQTEYEQTSFFDDKPIYPKGKKTRYMKILR